MGYRVIITDDEPKVLQLVKLLGHWEQYGIEIVDECHDGQAALESIKRNRPDFVLSDIKMPDLDGIELIEETRRAGIDSLFILLSGYRHFEYAQSAITLNVVDYLLKPIDEAKLNKTLERVCRQIDQRKGDDAGKAELLRIKERQQQATIRPLWEALVKNRYDPEVESNLSGEERLNRAYHTKFQKGSYQIIHVVTDISGVLDSANLMMNDEIVRLLAGCFEGRALYYYKQIRTGYAVILNYPPDHRKMIRESISALYYGLHNLTEVYGEFHLNIGVSRVHDSCRELMNAGREARTAEWGRLSMSRNGILEYDMVSHLKKINENSIISGEELESLSGCMKYLRLEELGELFGLLYRRSGVYSNCYPGTMAAAVFRIFDAAAEAVPEEKREELLNDCFSAYISAVTFPMVMKNLYRKLEDYIRLAQRNSQDKVRKPIGEAVLFIKKNYGNQISEEDVAQASHVSTAYLSRLFKEELEVDFHEYLTQIRLEEAEKLLAETNLSVKEIAGRVGYPDEKYFSKLFRKITGMKPTEYRMIYG